MAGTELSDRTGSALSVGVMLLPHSVETTAGGTDCRVDVAGVNAGRRAPESAIAEAWWFGRGAEKGAAAGVRDGSGRASAFAAVSGIVGFGLLVLQVNAWLLCDAV